MLFRPRLADRPNALGSRLRKRHAGAVGSGTKTRALSERALAVFVRPPVHRRASCWAIILGSIAVIGFCDYRSSLTVSLLIFYLIPIMIGTGWFGAGAGVRIVILCEAVRAGGDELRAYPHMVPTFVWWNVSTSTVVFLIVVWLLDSLLELRRQLEAKVALRTGELQDSVEHRRRLEREVLEVGSRERQTIGRELHDELGQHLTATALAAQSLAQQLGAHPAAPRAKAIVGWIEEGIGKARKLARGLLLAQIEPDRLEAELEELARGAGQAGVRCAVRRRGGPLHAGPGDCAQLFRIAQEAVRNAVVHGAPTSVDIDLISDEWGVTLVIEDDGHGIAAPASSRSPGMGLQIMEHRANLIGASLAILSSPGGGTKVVCRLPTHVTAHS